MQISPRCPTAIHGLASLLLAWLLMQAIHESGHVLGAWATGGRVTQVVLHPLAISRTDVSPNPEPILEIWAGPVIGILVPMALWVAARSFLTPAAAWIQFFAGFCLIANGAYLGYALIEPIGDGEELLRLGAPLWLLSLFALITIPAGLSLWHGLGPQFGIGQNAQTASWTATAMILGILLAVTLAEIALSQRE